MKPRVGLGFMAVLLTTSAACSPLDSDTRNSNIVLISIDTLRADHFNRDLMPKMYRWAESTCAIFPRAYAHSTWTLPSHATMLSGLIQNQHGMDLINSVLSPDVPLVQEELQAAGYKTLAFTGGGYVSKRSGLGRGFDTFFERGFGFDPKERKLTFGQIRESNWTAMQKAKDAAMIDEGDTPRFIFAHTYFVHQYFLFHFDPNSVPDDSWGEVYTSFVKTESIETKRACYERAVQALDARLYGFVQALLSSPLSRNLRIIITSDHGEGLGDKHGDHVSVSHAQPPYSDQTHIPLVACGPPKGRYEALVGLKNVPGMIRAFAGLKHGVAIPSEEFVVSEYVDHMNKNASRSLAVTFAEKQLFFGHDGKLSLFVGRDQSVDALSMRARATEGELSEQAKEGLRALGYLQ